MTVLHDLKNCFDDRGQRTPEGHETYRKHFTGKKAWFSDSSDSEKADFRRDLTFSHPADAGETLFCTWHGKVKTPQLRIHFSWPVHAAEPLYVVYVGPKITRRQDARVPMRRLVRCVLRGHACPPDRQESATRTVPERAKVPSAAWAGLIAHLAVSGPRWPWNGYMRPRAGCPGSRSGTPGSGG